VIGRICGNGIREKAAKKYKQSCLWENNSAYNKLKTMNNSISIKDYNIFYMY
jgi:hypothetical protein